MAAMLSNCSRIAPRALTRLAASRAKIVRTIHQEGRILLLSTKCGANDISPLSNKPSVSYCWKVQIRHIRSTQALWKIEGKEDECAKKEKEYQVTDTPTVSIGEKIGNQQLTKILSVADSIYTSKILNRKDNITITGLEFNSSDLKTEVEEFFRNNLLVEASVKNVQKLEECPHRYSSKKNVVLVTMMTVRDKADVMSRKRKLEGTTISLNHDFTKLGFKIDTMIAQRAKDEMAKGHQVKRGLMKIIIDGKCWKWNIVANKLLESEAYSDLRERGRESETLCTDIAGVAA